MADTPSTNVAAQVSFALLDELFRTLEAKGVITSADVLAIWKAATKRLQDDTGWDAQKAASFSRSRLASKD